MTRLVVLVVSQTILFFATRNALAQNESANCPGLDEPTSAEQQASCWFEKALSGSPGCTDDRQGVNACIRNAAGWCAQAAFDRPSMANTCFFAHLQAGELSEAQALERYITEPTNDVTRCLEALETTRVNFESVPAGAELRVNGQVYGKAPVEIELPNPWWNDKIVATFGAGPSATEVEVSPQELMASFDNKTCVMTGITVRGPQPPSPSIAEPILAKSVAEPIPAKSVVKPLPAKPVEPPTNASTETRSGILPLSAVSLALGGAGVVTGVVLLAIAGVRASDLESQETGTTWNSELEDKDNSLKPLSIGGGIALGVGAALATVGIVLIATDERSSTSPSGGKEFYSLRLNVQGIQLTGRF